MTEPTPAPIPRRLVFRALADCLGGQARHLEALPDRTRRRRPGAVADPAKAQARAARARRLRLQADTLSAWIGDPARYRGPGLDAAVCGYVVALAYGHAGALAELRAEMEDMGTPGVLDGHAAGDMVAIVEALCPVVRATS